METKVTKADLALIDAALKIHEMSAEAQKTGVTLSPVDPAAFPFAIALVAWVIEGVALALEAGRVPFPWPDISRGGQVPRLHANASLEDLIAARNAIAKLLNEK